MINRRELNAMVQLLDDNDPEVYNHIFQKLVSFGKNAIPALEEIWSQSQDAYIQQKLEEVIHSIYYEDLLLDFSKWAESENPDLLEGYFLVSRYYYPDLDFDNIKKQIFKIKQRIWVELNYNQSALEQIHVFNQVFYGVFRFEASAGKHLEYSEYCLNNLLETRKGNALSLGILYQIIANDLNLPVYGVTLLKHYILCMCKSSIENFSSNNKPQKEILFYINPFNRGSVFSRNEIKDYLQRLDAPEEPAFFNPASNKSVISELIYNLMDLHRHLGYLDKAEDLSRLRKILD
ncbi:MAG: transglutaminase family protein [Chitinophagales bacterium]|nr:transglutaminase family protein [Chitinophagales bacterium]